MKFRLKLFSAGICFLSCVMTSAAQDGPFNEIPGKCKWISKDEVAFTYDGTYTDSLAFSVYAPNHRITNGVKFPEKFKEFPLSPLDAVNLTYSPDSTMLAFTRANDLWVADIASGKETQLTDDGTDLIMNGYASWVYYEEILGRPSKYRAFWWSPDSRKIGFYRFDNTDVPLFPIYSPFGQDGTLISTRYPKAGETNPEVRIGVVDVASSKIVWADFDSSQDQYFGIPFWGADSKSFFISREPRIQNTLDLYNVNPSDGTKTLVYHETYKTWLDWIDGAISTPEGLYMARSFETLWQQVYYLSYSGELKRLTDGNNWNVDLLRADSVTGEVFFTANRDSDVRKTLYKVDSKGAVVALTDPSLNVESVLFSPDGKFFVAWMSNCVTPVQVWLFETDNAALAWRAQKKVVAGSIVGKNPSEEVTTYVDSRNNRKIGMRPASYAFKVADMKGRSYDPSSYALPKIIYITNDGLELPGSLVLPKDFDPSKKYPVHVDIYGGPDTPMVSDKWKTPSDNNQWWSEHGIIELTADCRASGHNGREGLDQIYKHLNTVEIDDFVAWAKYLQSLPYVLPDKIGVEGFSFGGTMTSALLFTASDYYHYGVAGGGVYDWALYDTHYTERFMETPSSNSEGYEGSRVLDYVSGYPASYVSTADSSVMVEPVMLKITHGTGDDNVHFQQTEQLIDKLQAEGKKFEFMIYPDGKHGYRGYQGKHSLDANREFWLKYLLH